MRRLLSTALGVLAAALVATAPGVAQAQQTAGAQPDIIGGTTATYSFMVSLSNGCGGSLVAPQWIVTANHCGSASQGRIGSINKNSGGEVGRIDRRITKPGTDLTLMHLSTAARATPVPMATSNPAANTTARLLGWGCTSCPTPDHAAADRPVGAAQQLLLRRRRLG